MNIVEKAARAMPARDEKKLEKVARVRRAIKAAYYENCDLDSDLLANAAITAVEQPAQLVEAELRKRGLGAFWKY